MNSTTHRLCQSVCDLNEVGLARGILTQYNHTQTPAIIAYLFQWVSLDRTVKTRDREPGGTLILLDYNSHQSLTCYFDMIGIVVQRQLGTHHP